ENRRRRRASDKSRPNFMTARFTGIGAWLGRKSDKLRHRQTILAAGLLLIALLPLVQLVLLRLLRNVVFLPGTTLGVGETFAGSFVLLLPFCLVTGFLLTLVCGLTGDIGGVYVADGIGSVAGGVVFSFILIRYLDHFGILCVPALLTLAVVGCYRQWRVVAAVLCLGVAGAWWWNVDAWSTARQYPGARVVLRENSPYGRLVITEAAGQFNFIENGLPIIATHNVEQVEETVHYAMAQRPAAQRVLLIGGGVTGTALEILKYPAAEVTYVELDPLIIAAGKRFMPATLEHVRVINTDGRLFLKTTDEKFDVVIVDLPAPVTSQLNRFYTAEFFAAIKRVLPADGVVAFAAGRYENYISRQLARLLASAYRTVRESFSNVLVIPGERVFFVASAGDLTLEIATQLEQAKIPTQFVQRHYLTAMLTPDRLADVQRALAAPAEVNRDFSPVLYFYHLQNWLSQFPIRFGLLEAAVLTALGIYLWRLRPVTLAIFAGGFAASTLEIVLLLGVQIVCGALYRQLGVIVAVFMAGLAVGAWLARQWPARQLAGLAFGVAAVAALIPAVLQFTGNLPVIVAVTFILATVVGMEFPVASRAEAAGGAATASRLYEADLVGACLGAWLASTLLIPLLGVTLVCVVTAALNGAAGVVVWRRKI
ncbi:MAG: fused MFS/spermidine synthase, partial [Verrucomicrobiota bacterium]